jgi:hypothetical protein
VNLDSRGLQWFKRGQVVGGGRLRHRGPDWSGLFVNEAAGVYLAHERLAIIDPASGDQPLFNENKDIVVAVSVLFSLEAIAWEEFSARFEFFFFFGFM